MHYRKPRLLSGSTSHPPPHTPTRPRPHHSVAVSWSRPNQQDPKTTADRNAGDASKPGRRPEELRLMEDELRDPQNFAEYLLPRPLRSWLLWGGGASSGVATLFTCARLLQDSSTGLGLDPSALKDLAINIAGAALFIGLAVWDQRNGEERVEQRTAILQAQIRLGDRELYINDQGEKMSRLKEVNDDWIIRRLEAWGRRDNMPFLGPKKGKLLQRLVREKQPRQVLEVGTMAGYSALLMGQALGPGSKVLSLEKELMWVLVAKRFMWQASQGEKNKEQVKMEDKVDVRWADALDLIPRLAGEGLAGKVDLVLLDGVPKEYLAYLKACEPLLAPGALVIADNAGVFKDGGLKPYLEYVRNSPRFQSTFLESTLEWRDDVPDGMEVSVYQG